MPAADGLERKYPGDENPCPMIRDPITLPFSLDQLTVGLVGKRHLRDAGDRQRIDDAEDHRGDDRHQHGGDEIASDVHDVSDARLRHYASPSAVITTSMALMPMNGTMTPPTP